MNVAIIGAGVAGLACAHELEKHNISPVIYEQNAYIGEQYPHVGAMLELIDRPVVDVIIYIKNEFDIDIKPLNVLTKLITYSPKDSYEVRGNLGYFVERGRNSNDLKNQLYAQLNNTKIKFNEVADYETLKNQYDYVVIANGSPSFSKELGCFNELFNGFIRGAIVLGEFDPNALIAWINKDYCKSGYVYLTPFNNKKAFIGLIASDVNESEVEHYWDLFKSTENINYPIVEEFKLNHISGFVYPHTVSNTLLAGNAGGALDPFLGFGQFTSIAMGVMAGKSIITGDDYDKLLKYYIFKQRKMHQFRIALNKGTNKDYDKAIALVKIPPLKHLVYNTKIDFVKHGANIIKFLSKRKG
ncbi:MAG TPA: dehydrogenase [Clostridiales bacterium]|nr:MAG: dehydrogenase [Clostridiales bacterium GWD2_32_19]HCC08248.1 dehydrogenase [Clostridiales bacterium]